MRKRILFIDDESWYVQPFVERLDMEGFEVACADSEDAAWDLLNRSKDYCLFIVDSMMPAEDEETARSAGVRFAERVREAGINVPIIWYSVVSDPIIRDRAMRFGSDFISKDASMATFLRKVRAAAK